MNKAKVYCVASAVAVCVASNPNMDVLAKQVQPVKLEEKVRYIATRISSRSSSGVFMEFSARRRGEIHEGSVPFLPASMDCAPQDLERLFARPFRLSGYIVWWTG